MSKLLMVGSGGLGSNQAKIFIQMGFGQIDLIDPDLVEDSNRNRQLFKASDVGKPKAHRVLRNLAPFALYSTKLRGYFLSFEEWLEQQQQPHYDGVCCGVDSLPSMVAVARYGLCRQIPVIFTNVSTDGEACRIFLQRGTKLFINQRFDQPFDFAVPKFSFCLTFELRFAHLHADHRRQTFADIFAL